MFHDDRSFPEMTAARPTCPKKGFEKNRQAAEFQPWAPYMHMFGQSWS
jgi:hypothetical protein